MFAALVYPFERFALRHAELVLTDTQLHAEYYQREFSIPGERILTIPVGAVESVPAAGVNNPVEEREFSVLFYGSFLPLHGIPVIIEAATRLTDIPVRFDFVGGTRQQARRLHRDCRSLGITNFTHRRWVAFEDLITTDIPRADLCLGGPFGGTPQGRRVVTGKTSQCLATGKATLIGRIDEDFGFQDRENCLLVEQADPVSLAASIRWAYENRGKLHEIGVRGLKVYNERLSIRVIAQRLQQAVQDLVA